MVRVTAAVIERGGQILIAKRRRGDRLGGLWEFPGGKIEDGEDPRDCLARELREELGITAAIGELLVSHGHRYPHTTIELLSYRATHLAGDLELRDHDEVRWVRPEEMEGFAFAPADLPTVAFLQVGSSEPEDGASGAGPPRGPGEDAASPPVVRPPGSAAIDRGPVGCGYGCSECGLRCWEERQAEDTAE